MADKRIMTPEEKALLQARHRQEEAEARNRKKERDARTHRLVQEGAILESIVPHIKEMDLDSLKRELMIRLRECKRTSSTPEGRTYSPPDKSGSGIPFGARALCRGLYPLLQATSKGGARYGNLSYASQSRQPWFRSVCCCCFCLYEL